MLMFKRILQIILIIAVALFLCFLFLRKSDIPVEELKKEYTNTESKFIEINGMQAHYRIEGNGPHVILLHGTAASLHTWKSWVDVLQDSFTVLTVDIPGFGLTGADPNHDYSTKAYNAFLNEITQKLSIEHFHLGGNSLGGYISWNYALDHPERVDKLILVDAAGFPHESPSIFKLIRNPILAPIIKRIGVRSLIESNLQEVYYDDSKITEQLIDRYYAMSLRAGNRDALIARVKRQDINRVDQLDQIEEPTLLMWGEADLWVPFEDAMKFDQAIPNSKIISYKDAGHIPMEEKPVQSAQDALDFLLEK